jgi:hypothetical protein
MLDFEVLFKGVRIDINCNWFNYRFNFYFKEIRWKKNWEKPMGMHQMERQWIEIKSCHGIEDVRAGKYVQFLVGFSWEFSPLLSLV